MPTTSLPPFITPAAIIITTTAATAAIIDRRDTIIVSSVSCIYSIGEKEEYINKMLNLYVGQKIERDAILEKLVSMQYERNSVDFKRGTFRARGDIIELIPIGEKKNGVRVELFDDEVEKISLFDPLTGKNINNLNPGNIKYNFVYKIPNTNVYVNSAA